nr:MAG TPA: hypothetical protein [Caudoviricetes sp.]
MYATFSKDIVSSSVQPCKRNLCSRRLLFLYLFFPALAPAQPKKKPSR